MRTTAEHDASVHVETDGRRLALGVHAVRDLAALVLRREGVRQALLSIAFVSRRHIARLNRVHLGHPGGTDVLTFALGRLGARSPLVGDIYIAPDVVREQARRHGVAVRDELARVVVHGVLHALGHDHPENGMRTKSPMWRRQERYLDLARREGVI